MGAHLGGAEQGSQTGTGIATTGHSPETGTTNPHLGTVDTGGPQPPVTVVPAQVIVPPQPPAQLVPVRQKQKAPPQLPKGVPLIATPHPTDVHNGPVAQMHLPGSVLGPGGPAATGGTGITSGITPAGKPKPRPHVTVALPHNPSATTSRPHVVAVPGKPRPAVTGGQVPDGHAHYLVPTEPNSQLPHGIGASIWLNEVIEPGIENQRVELYRSIGAWRISNPADTSGIECPALLSVHDMDLPKQLCPNRSSRCIPRELLWQNCRL